ncbi:F0F1 ATP synthase subunit B [Marivita sp. GX14005]|uniref:F0F1 ATP synthase subunit B n=1 Tax=Marivita sp. GX14005 TaxID=2942276 RepID=UPI002018AC7C|nr:F0F1 ATP synthase subunit B [Marivita sp. GX14005]MCL3881972.1 F0F1 ATP synthase subunit B [Marivita sp. GX14005]
MRPFLVALAASVVAVPAHAADGPFISLNNTDFVVLLGFIVFIGILLYYRVPTLLMKMLDKRAENIRAELDEAKAIREEAQALLASYERQQREVRDQADRIIAHAKQEAAAAGEQAKVDLKKSIERRLAAAEDQIASAEASAVKEVRDRAIAVAVAAARDVVAKQMSKQDAAKTIDESIATVGQKLH